MAIEVPKTKKTNWMLIIIVIAIAVMAYFAWNLLKAPIATLTEPKANEILDPQTQQIKNLNLNIEAVLGNSTFQGLMSHLTLPLPVPTLGRKNPFLPY